jgi:hypothetical protein
MKTTMKKVKTAPVMKNGGKMKKYAAGGKVVPTVDNSMMSKGGKVMAKKAMGGKIGKKAC